MAGKAGFEPTTLRSNGVVSTNAPPCPTNVKPLMESVLFEYLLSASVKLWIKLLSDHVLIIITRSVLVGFVAVLQILGWSVVGVAGGRRGFEDGFRKSIAYFAQKVCQKAPFL